MNAVYSDMNNDISTLRTESPSMNVCRHLRQYWACSKFKLFCGGNQTVMAASTVFVSKCKCYRERTSSFSPFRICVFSAFASSIGTISPLKSKLATFQYKEVKKLGTEVKLTVNWGKTYGAFQKQSNGPWNTETHKTDWHPPITNHKARAFVS